MSVNLSTTYLGLRLKSPLVTSACQALTENLDSIKRIEDAGAGAIVMHSLFEEQVASDALELHKHTTAHTDSFAEAASFFPEPEDYVLGPDEYLELLAKAKKSVKVPLIASLNGTTAGGWTQIAKQMEQAGADALELNIYRVNADASRKSEDLEQEYVDILKSVKKQVRIPVAVKLSPYFTSMANMAKRLDEAGANGLVLFNRFYQPDIDLEELEVRPDVILSSPLSMRLPLTWIGLLHGRVTADLAATSGIHKAEDAIKLILVGANVTMLCSVLLRYGVDQIKVITKRLQEWMQEKGYESVDEMRGSISQEKCDDPSAFERAQYLRVIHSYKPGRKVV